MTDLNHIVSVVLEEYGGKLELLNSKTHAAPYPRVRQCICFLLKNHYYLSDTISLELLGYSKKNAGGNSMARINVTKYREAIKLSDGDHEHYQNILLELGLAKKTVAIDDISSRFKIILENTVKELNTLIKMIQ